MSSRAQCGSKLDRRSADLAVVPVPTFLGTAHSRHEKGTIICTEQHMVAYSSIISLINTMQLGMDWGLHLEDSGHINCWNSAIATCPIIDFLCTKRLELLKLLRYFRLLNELSAILTILRS